MRGQKNRWPVPREQADCDYRRPKVPGSSLIIHVWIIRLCAVWLYLLQYTTPSHTAMHTPQLLINGHTHTGSDKIVLEQKFTYQGNTSRARCEHWMTMACHSSFSTDVIICLLLCHFYVQLHNYIHIAFLFLSSCFLLCCSLTSSSFLYSAMWLSGRTSRSSTIW